MKKPELLNFNATLTIRGSKYRVSVESDCFDFIHSRERLCLKHEFWEYGFNDLGMDEPQTLEDHYSSSLTDIIIEHGDVRIQLDVINITLNSE